MTPSRRLSTRPYLFEVFAVANLLLIWWLLPRGNHYVILTLPSTLRTFIPTLAGYAAAGFALRLLVAWRTGTLKPFLGHVRTPGWWSDAARLIFFGAIATHTYFWIKLVMPFLHPRFFDAELWELDRKLFFGLSPNVLFLNLFSEPIVLKAIDWSYARLFFVSMTIAFAYFLSHPSRRVRVSYATGNAVLWLAGAWLYIAVPALGPVYRFPDVWFAYSESLGMTQHFQAILMQNFQRVLALGTGRLPDPQIMLGIAAFPSLHVGFQTFVFLWMRRLWTWGEIVFGVLALIIVIGSVVTGWHYLVDSIAGALLAVVAYLVGSRAYRFRRWRRVHAAVGK